MHSHTFLSVPTLRRPNPCFFCFVISLTNRCLKRCYPNSIESTTRNNPEDMCVFEIDDTSLENHMPQSVVRALNMLLEEIQPLFDKQADAVLYKPDHELLNVEVVDTNGTTDDRMPEDNMEIELTAEVH